MEHFTPLASTIGGIMIGVAAAMLMLLNGRVAGITGIFNGVLRPQKGEFSWRAAFLVGLLGGGVAAFLAAPEMFRFTITRTPYALAAAGLLVGFGTRLGNGCTSGHGVCGLARFSKRSLVATVTFMTTGAVAVFVVNHLFGGVL